MVVEPTTVFRAVCRSPALSLGFLGPITGQDRFDDAASFQCRDRLIQILDAYSPLVTNRAISIEVRDLQTMGSETFPFRMYLALPIEVDAVREHKIEAAEQ